VQGSIVSVLRHVCIRFVKGRALDYGVDERVSEETRLESPVPNHDKNLWIAKSHANRRSS